MTTDIVLSTDGQRRLAGAVRLFAEDGGQARVAPCDVLDREAFAQVVEGHPSPLRRVFHLRHFLSLEVAVDLNCHVQLRISVRYAVRVSPTYNLP